MTRPVGTATPCIDDSTPLYHSDCECLLVFPPKLPGNNDPAKRGHKITNCFQIGSHALAPAVRSFVDIVVRAHLFSWNAFSKGLSSGATMLHRSWYSVRLDGCTLCFCIWTPNSCRHTFRFMLVGDRIRHVLSDRTDYTHARTHTRTPMQSISIA